MDGLPSVLISLKFFNVSQVSSVMKHCASQGDIFEVVAPVSSNTILLLARSEKIVHLWDEKSRSTHR